MKIEYSPEYTSGILFLCTGSIFRSRAAASLARKYGIDAFSRGFDVNRVYDEFTESMGYLQNGKNNNIIIDPDAYAFLKKNEVEDYMISSAPKQLLPKDFAKASIVVCMNYKEHYPMMEKFRMTYNINPHNVCYWDVPDIQKEEGWKGYEDNLDSMEKSDILLLIKDKVSSLK